MAEHGASLRELPLLPQVNLRAEPVDGLPTQPNTVGERAGASVLWLGPDEWLLVGEEGSGLTERGLRAELGEAALAVTDVSGQRTVLELRGPGARDVLEQGCSLDLHPRHFGPGQCAQALLARADVILWQTEADPPAYRLLVGCSFAPYLAAWLRDAMSEPALA